MTETTGGILQKHLMTRVFKKSIISGNSSRNLKIAKSITIENAAPSGCSVVQSKCEVLVVAVLNVLFENVVFRKRCLQ